MARHGQQALVGSCIGESPLMHFVQWLVSVEDCHYHLADRPQRVEELFDAMQAVVVRSAEIMAEHKKVIKAFRGKGFEQKAILDDYFIRKDGVTHDVMLMMRPVVRKEEAEF